MKPEEMRCPKCQGVLFVRTAEEIVAEIQKKTGVESHLAWLMLIPRTGGMMRWWCALCEREVSAYEMLGQAFTVQPLNADEREEVENGEETD